MRSKRWASTGKSRAIYCGINGKSNIPFVHPVSPCVSGLVALLQGYNGPGIHCELLCRISLRLPIQISPGRWWVINQTFRTRSAIVLTPLTRMDIAPFFSSLYLAFSFSLYSVLTGLMCSHLSSCNWWDLPGIIVCGCEDRSMQIKGSTRWNVSTVNDCLHAITTTMIIGIN